METSMNSVAIDLSLKPVNTLSQGDRDIQPLVRPIPRLPWTITWYQSVWPNRPVHTFPSRFSTGILNNRNFLGSISQKQPLTILQVGDDQGCRSVKEVNGSVGTKLNTAEENDDNGTHLAAVLDIACCDGPVVFERVSNPNFALTVEHSNCPTGAENISKVVETRQLALKTYLCIYCNQSFKSLFCYQKHKKRHLNPVSVDITATHDEVNRNHENKTTTKDLNVQFFPCKKCGSKFPSYYFVHKHRKVCHPFETS